MAKKRGIGQITTDLERQINADFNALIQLTVEGLSTEQNSPVDTGFFASSWKASTQRTSPKDKREDFKPWSNIKPKSGNQRIEPRFTVPQFNYKKQPTVYIGNATEYAAYALQSPKVANFIQGEMRSLVQQTFREKKGGRLFAATGGTDPSQGVGIFKGRTSVSYERI
jgi:hypothetical protein